MEWHEQNGHGRDSHGHNILTVEVAESYAGRALECAESTARELAAANALDLTEVELVVATASIPGFGERLAERLGVSTERVALPSGDLAATHTAAAAVSLESVELAAARTALFVSAGGGITAIAALYRT